MFFEDRHTHWLDIQFEYSEAHARLLAYFGWELQYAASRFKVIRTLAPGTASYGQEVTAQRPGAANS